MSEKILLTVQVHIADIRLAPCIFVVYMHPAD